jgi:nicotinamide riboside kinase
MKKALALFALLTAVSSQAFAAPDGQNRRVQIANRSSQAVHFLYASPVTTNNWEEDLLGNGTIAPGASVEANIDNGTNQCNYDLKIVMANAQEHIRRAVNVCAVSRITVTNTGTSAE